MKRSLGLAVLVGAAASTIYQRIGDARDARRYPAPGTLVDVGGRRLHIVDHGGTGLPVVIETGAGTLALSWGPLVAPLAESYRVITYDRAGYGWSDADGWYRSGNAVADDLRALLDRAGVEGPFLLVGHSLGGLYTRCFAIRHRESTVGLVLIDASHENMMAKAREMFGSKAVVAQAAASLGLAALPRGLTRAGYDIGLLRGPLTKVAVGGSDDDARLRVAFYLRSAFRKASLAETLAVPATMKALRQSGKLGDLPIAIVTSAAPAPTDHSLLAKFRGPWLELQADLATLSRDSLHLTASKGGHFVYQDDPEIVIRAIRHVVDRAKRQRKAEATSPEPTRR